MEASGKADAIGWQQRHHDREDEEGNPYLAAKGEHCKTGSSSRTATAPGRSPRGVGSREKFAKILNGPETPTKCSDQLQKV